MPAVLVPACGLRKGRTPTSVDGGSSAAILVTSIDSARQSGQQAGEAASEHSFARTGWTDEEQVVAAGRCYLQGPFRRPLASHVRQIGRIDLDWASAWRDGHLRRDRFALQVAYQLREGSHRDHRQLAQRGGFAGVGRRQAQLLVAVAGGNVGYCQRSAHRPYAAVEAQLAAEDPAFERTGLQIPEGGHARQRDRQIQVVAFFFEIGGSQVDDHHSGRQVETAVFDRRADSFAALTDRGVGQADNVVAGDAVADVDLDLYKAGVDTQGVAEWFFANIFSKDVERPTCRQCPEKMATNLLGGDLQLHHQAPAGRSPRAASTCTDERASAIASRSS
jgi:hypothetical protein